LENRKDMSLDWSFIKQHYLKDEIKEQIIKYSKDRWIALENTVENERIFYRYFRNKEPLKISNEVEYKKLFLEFRFRTIYASINLYRKIDKDLLKDLNNIYAVTPVFDIDGSLDDLEVMKRVAEIIISELDKYGIKKSIYLVWSGRGIHIHIHEKAFTLNYHPLDIAFSIVDFIIKKTRDEIAKEIIKAKNIDRELKVENKIDIQRVFTVPFSFHRFLDFVCVPFKPNSLNNFDLSWVNPNNFKYDKNWYEFEEGEGNELAEIAIKESKGYTGNLSVTRFLERKPIITPREVSKIRKKEGKIGRFQVMGLLQAARYYLLKGDLNKAKSFGLNRAIFYAWAKYYRPVYKFSKKTYYTKILKVVEVPEEKFEVVGNEKAPIGSNGWFMIGDKEQTPEDFDKNIKEKIEQYVDFETAWRAAIEYLKKFPEEVLKDQQLFFKKVYEPVRDKFGEIIEKYGKVKKEEK